MFSKKSRQQFPAPAKQPSELSQWLDKQEARYVDTSSADYVSQQKEQNEIRRAVELKDIRDHFGGGSK